MDVKTEIKTNPPLHIPISKTNDTKYHVRLALKIAINTIKERNKSLKLSCVILYHRQFFLADDIKQALVECEVDKENIILHPRKQAKSSLKQLEQYLRDSIGVYVVPQRFIVGMESKNIILS